MYKVVIVDDEDIIVNGLKKIIDWESFHCQVVATAYDVASGSAAIREHQPDILFTDIRMPDNSGLAMLTGLRSEFPNMKGFSSRNLKYMRAFAKNWSDITIVQEALAQLPWYHHVTLLDKLNDNEERLAYMKLSIEHGWSRNTLVHHIELQTAKRVGKAQNNFDNFLPKQQSDLAKETLKDPYKFDFLTISNDAHELEIKNALIYSITEFLLELGSSFAYVGKEVLFEVGGDDFYADLLFYHLKLHCYVVIELKTGKFKPEYLGQLSFYMTAVDKQVKAEIDAPTIGLLLCKSKNEVVVEYALQDVNKPIGISEYDIINALPDEIKNDLPTIEEIEAGLKELKYEE